LAYSNDRGRTWTKYENNPVLPHVVGSNRDPKVIWYAPEKKWVLALYLEKNDYGLFSSPDLKHWERMSTVTVPGTTECPEFFEIPLDGKKSNTRWIFYGGNGHYLVGKFDGTTFTPDAGPFPINTGNCFYASQTYNDIPAADGRRILVTWGQSATPGMPFNQMLGLPVELTLVTTDEGPRIFVNPIRELASLRGKSHKLKAQDLKPGENPLADIKGELLDVTAEFTVGDASEINLNLRGVAMSYNAKKQELSCKGKTGALKPIDGKIRLRVLVDRTSVDIFGNGGALYMPMGGITPLDNHSLALTSLGTAKIDSLVVSELNSSWE
jgi:sucrose-6-phosphate hydrolase SacC (GH32 family)